MGGIGRNTGRGKITSLLLSLTVTGMRERERESESTRKGKRIIAGTNIDAGCPNGKA